LTPVLDSGSHINARHEPRAPARRLHALVRCILSVEPVFLNLD
jgi:hypothetical protein